MAEVLDLSLRGSETFRGDLESPSVTVKVCLVIQDCLGSCHEFVLKLSPEQVSLLCRSRSHEIRCDGTTKRISIFPWPRDGEDKTVTCITIPPRVDLCGL